MDSALQQTGKHCLNRTAQLHETWNLSGNTRCRAKLLAVTRIWRSPGQNDQVVAVKGAPGAVAELCRVSQSQFEEIKGNAEALAAEGLRILAVARADFRNSALPEDPHGFDFKFLGLVHWPTPFVRRSQVR